ncbi:unnamed protein product [Ilex paraguariensis]|uniref:Early light-induced protein n=1 Tax=Ilex paraguariensis TaxID=185542 RepID=A0ABC8TTM0_9AQUA
MAMQSFLASSMTLVSGTTRVSQFVPSTYVPSLQRNANFRVRSMAEKGEKEESSPVTAPSLTPPPKPAPAAKVSTKFSDVLAFSGPAPERINGRLAMIGFVAAIGAELASGQDVFTQLSDGGVPWFLGTSIVLSLASLIPLFKGVTVQSKSEGLMTSDAELWNGRFAMLGLVALVFTEYLKGGALV